MTFQTVPFFKRAQVYFGLWLLVIVLFQVFLPPDGLDVTGESPLQQRLMLALSVPLIVAMALASPWAFLATDGSGMEIPVMGALAGLAVHGVIMLRKSQRSQFNRNTIIQIIYLAAGFVLTFAVLIPMMNRPMSANSRTVPSIAQNLEELGDQWLFGFMPVNEHRLAAADPK